MAQKQYEWAPLQDPEAIRVLSIEESHEDTKPIRCHLNECPISESTKYITLSYVWGPTYDDESHLTHVVICDDQTLRITASLHAALTAVRQHLSSGKLRDRGLQLPIWADAICINQSDTKERSLQVALVDQIYRQSQHLFIWLGKSHHAHEIIYERLQKNQNYYWPEDERLIEFTLDLYRRTWFKRRWVIQELMHSLGADFMIGQWSIPIEKLDKCIPITAPEILHEWKRRNIHGVSMPPRHGGTLVEYMAYYESTECSDPRDRVYALLSISKDTNDFTVDYELDERALFQIIAIRCVIQGMTAEILVRATCNRPCSRSSRPSWVPDWSYPHYKSRDHWEAAAPFLKPKDAVWGGNNITERIAISGDRLRLDAWILGPCQKHAGPNAETCAQCTASRLLDSSLEAEEWADRSRIQVLILCPGVQELEYGTKLAFLVYPALRPAEYELVACKQMTIGLRSLARDLGRSDQCGISDEDSGAMELLTQAYQSTLWIV